MAKERTEEAAKIEKTIQEERKRKQRNQPLKVFRQGVGKYLNTAAVATETVGATDKEPVVKKKKETPKSSFGNFSSW